jgi:hypothetical protein
MIELFIATLAMAGPLLAALLLWLLWALAVLALCPLIFGGILVYCWLTGQRFDWRRWS